MIAFMRNRRTTENRAVELDGAEFLGMRQEIDPSDGLPVWEQTSSANQLQQAARIESGNATDEDVGDAQQPIARIMDTGPSIEVGGGRDALTDAEVEAGLTPELKREQLGEDPLVSGNFSFGPQNTIEPVPTDELHDDEEDVLARDEGSGSGGADGDEATVDELKDELRARGLPVSGNKSELQARLDQDEAREDADDPEDE